MADRLPSLNALRAFDAAARHLSLTRAAAELHVTPAAISHQIKGLEEDLGVVLFRRVGRELRLTDAAQAAVPALREAFDRLAEATRRLRAGDGDRVVTVNAPPTFASAWLVPRLDRFKDCHPDIDVRLDASADLVDFARNAVDIAVRYGAGDHGDLDTVKLFDDDMFPVCSPRLLSDRRPLRSPADLARHTLLHYDWTAHAGVRPDWKMWLVAAGADVDASRGPRFSHQGMALDAALRGQGVALGSHALCGDDLAAGRLVQPFDMIMALDFAYYAVTPRPMLRRRTVIAFRDWILAEAGHQAPRSMPAAATAAAGSS